MAAHLHRYKSELHRVEFILQELSSMSSDASLPGTDNVKATSDTDRPKVGQLKSQLSAITSFSDELERKVQNILTLVSQ